MVEKLKFRKMHGAGNDFVIVDARLRDPQLSVGAIRQLGDRHKGVGFDQFAILRAATDADIEIEFFNSDGSPSAACGNATRCIADLIMGESGKDRLAIRTARGMLDAKNRDGAIWVNMGQPHLDWRDIPLSQSADISALPLDGGPGAVGMGNPHCVFVVEDADVVDPAERGPQIEHHPLFPERTNVEFASIIDRSNIRLRVWERGAGVTLACGSGACAAAVHLARLGLSDRQARLHMDGGTLEADWREDGVWLTGPVAYVFEAEIDPRYFSADA